MKKQHKARGFTLIELLIVIVIIGLLASLVAPTMFSKVSSSQRSTAAAQMQMLETALDTYRLDNGAYPESLQELRKGDKPTWDGPYLPRDIPADPWGNPYQYEIPGKDGEPYSLFSFGSDGVVGGTGDAEDIIHR